MRKLITIVLIVISLTSCRKVCDCVYYTAEKDFYSNWIVVHQERWDGCNDQDFGYTDYYYPNGFVIKTHSYVVCK